MIAGQGTYGDRRVWGNLKYQGVDGQPLVINHIREYMTGAWPLIKATNGGALMVLSWPVTMVSAFVWHSLWTAVIARR